MGVSTSSESLAINRSASLAMLLSSSKIRNSESSKQDLESAGSSFPDPAGPKELVTPQIAAQPAGISLLALPYEIRSHIYVYVLLDHPIRHAHLAPPVPPASHAGMNTIEFHTIRLRPDSSSLPTYTARGLENSLSAMRSPTIQGKIPTGLLLSCKQVYEEARLLPWERNYFNFINWFWSGIYAGRQFSMGIAKWQLEGLRFVAVEVLGKDLGSDKPGTAGLMVDATINEWSDLCGLWEGVWGLKLCIKGSVGADIIPSTDSSRSSFPEIQAHGLSLDRTILDIGLRWVPGGLLKMTRLRWIELEIEDGDISRDDKMAFCQALENAFTDNDNVESRDMRVILVERAKEDKKPVPNKDFVWYGGEPGNDSIWGLDVN